VTNPAPLARAHGPRAEWLVARLSRTPMDAQPTQPESPQRPASIAGPLEARRERMLALAAAQRKRIADLEARVLDRIDRANTAIVREREEAGVRLEQIARQAEEIDCRSLEVARQKSELDELAGSLERRTAALATAEQAHAQRHHELETRAKELDSAREALRHERQRLASDQEQFASEQQAVAHDANLPLKQVAAKLAALEREQAELAAEQARTQAQRQRIADGLRREHETQWRAITETRDRASREVARQHELVNAQQLEVETQLGELANRVAQCNKREAELDRRTAELAGEQETFARRRAEIERKLSDRHTELEAGAAQLDAKKGELDTATTRNRSAQQSLAAEHATRLEDVGRLQQAAEAKLAQLDRERTELAAERELQLADLARSQKVAEAKLAQLDREQSELAAQCERTTAQRQRIATYFKREREALLESGCDDSARYESEHARATQLERDCDELRRQLANPPALPATSADPSQAELIAELTAERNDLARRLTLAESSLAEARDSADTEGTAPDQESGAADLAARYEMAVRDIRELKRQNEELAKKSTATAHVAAAAGAAMDWEARKRQLLDSLADDDDEDHRAERLEMEELVRKTDTAVSEKQREIDELRRRLDEQSSSEPAVDTSAALAEVLDKDDVVRQERERLKQLEKDWEEKFRQAEIEMSVQRAQIARNRAEIDEKQRALELQGGSQAAGQAGGDVGKAKKAGRGRWLSRLGLAEDEK
jgi:hypothetical protein